MNEKPQQGGELSAKEQIRYARQIMLDDVGMDGQQRLKQAHILVIGCGGLGSPALMYLASSGVGQITLMDNDVVELSNLQRQIMFKINHLGQAKAKAAAKVLASLNNEIVINAISQKADENNLAPYIECADIVLDCTDNFATRYMINRICHRLSTPLISAAATGYQGHVVSFDFRQPHSPCYECLFPERSDNPVDNCANLGVIAPLLGVMGSQQALLAIRLLQGEAQSAVVHSFDARTLSQKHLGLTKNADCSCSRQQKAEL
ncbi:HesA/MoeB/ThiF family protein [Pseudoalteromonas sp. SSDWG2]|uniref:HesA/MoeB/ThiF family protein n=1 Tax=Pseudoalteromonas sp. SSDWG2 TaxID=3139391 RepID=UPI003BA986D1